MAYLLTFLLLALLVRYGYGWGMAVRNALYDHGWLASEAYPVPVIALGNLRVGGTGKSPHAAYVVEALLSAGYRVALLSRGYGRRTRGFRLVTAADTAAAVGDEPLEQARRFVGALQRGELLVAVAEDRRVGIRALLALAEPPAVLVLDDAYQHRAVRPSLLLLLTEFHRPFTSDRILPLGRLREFPRAAHRADAVIITKCPEHVREPANEREAHQLADRAELLRGLNLPVLRRTAGAAKPVFFTAYDYDRWQPLLTPAASLPPTTILPPAALVVLTAIDNPAPLYDHLLHHGFTIAHQLRFPDHHLFSAADLAAVRAASGPAHLPVVTTGKDATRLLNEATGQPRPEIAHLPVWWVPVRVREVKAAESVAPASLRELVLDHVRQFRATAGRVAAVLLFGAVVLFGGPLYAQQTPASPTPGNPASPPAAQPQPGQLTKPTGQPTKPGRPKRLLNDSTKVLYGPRTTRLFYEADALAGNGHEIPFDTGFHQMWNVRQWYHDSTFQQDLGNVGTAARPLLWPVGQPQAGIRWGRRAFDRYAYDVSGIPFYDARSPYSHLYYIQGALGEQVFEARYTRNIKKVFNFGGAYQRLSANKQLAPEQAKDNLLNHASALVWATYATPDSTWRVFASYSHTYHEVIEQGGARYDVTSAGSRFDTAQVNLYFASNREFRNSWHLTQLLRLAGPGLQLFYTFDRRVQANRFRDTELVTSRGRAYVDSLFWDNLYLSHSRTDDNARFRINQHTAGILGGARFGSYRLYASRRDVKYDLYRPGGLVPVAAADSAVLQPRRIGRVAFGGEAQFRVRNLVGVTVDGELQSGDNTYWLRATGRLGPVTVSQLRNGYSPTITEDALYGNHFRWENAFANTQRDETRLTVGARFGRHHFWFDGAFDRIRNYIYFDQRGQPRQENSTISVATAQGRWRVAFGSIVVDTRAAVTSRPGRAAAVVRTPEIIGDVLAYYQGWIIKQALFIQAGAEAYVQSDSRALAWQPANQQFYLQDGALLKAYPVIDVFIAADIKNVNIFLKMAHANYGLPRNSYYQTPNHPQLARSFTFGLKWAFFD